MDLYEYYIIEEAIGDVNKFYLRAMNELNIDASKNTYNIIDDEEAIENWKKMLSPYYKAETNDKIVEFRFTLLSFYLFKEGFYLANMPNLLERAPRFEDTVELFRIKTGEKFGRNGQYGGVGWSDRGRYLEELKFIKKTEESYNLDQELEALIKLVSTSGTDFNTMTANEKLATIRNTFENIAKKDSKRYHPIPFHDLTYGLITSDDVTRFNKKLHVFRHGEKSMLSERENYTQEEKSFMIDYALLILQIARNYIKTTISVK
ncbi:hypothetical protein [Erysipelothrix aquatica]|uniref:hypothetical protein n=1 Tax=Erysipelothrix aquatica TaxID=2683714 RepID=UPI0013581E3D|nr:hypothetical protein [Erysipelothrix aquatica]